MTSRDAGPSSSVTAFSNVSAADRHSFREILQRNIRVTPLQSPLQTPA